MERSKLLDAVIRIAIGAGAVILKTYHSDFAVVGKRDASPVTEADLRAEQLLLRELTALTPGVPIVSEESAAIGKVPKVGSRFWLVDPLDGTRDFVDRNGEFTVNIAWIEDTQPVLGVVHAPALRRTFCGARSLGAFVDDDGHRRPIACRLPPAEGLTVLSSRFHGDERALDAYLSTRRVARRVQAGSSLKFCLIAAGEADLYPRFGRTMEWDTAAGHAVLASAGGRLAALDGEALFYGKPGFTNPHFIAEGVRS